MSKQAEQLELPLNDERKRTRRKMGQFILRFRRNNVWEFVALPTEVSSIRDAEKWIKDNEEKINKLADAFTLCREVAPVKIKTYKVTEVIMDDNTKTASDFI